MEIVPAQFYSAMGAIFAALIAGFLSLLSLVTSKDQKLSELRHEWITDFRKELSELIAEVRYSEFWAEQFRNNPVNVGKNPYLEDVYKSAFLSISKSVSSLGLRINPRASNKKLRTLNEAFLVKLNELKTTYWKLTWAQADTLTAELREIAGPILQSEWQHIERGELGHRILKIVAGSVLVLGLVGVVLIGMRLAHITSPSVLEAPTPQVPSQPVPSTKQNVR